ncbi:acylphosphatase [Natronosporangium hydrolyticum]|uniref:acylphosphatase n=1 Tax=Natronosporangium hydrolyticum TaxID=2811111 RepID=A0A895YCM5_9ACTN|nr:acylphosphatase [Natronosporangium hydrolyticum]QSB15251.1 acylphosphatase [Natronosporangium hydrolyticum]
MTLQLTRVRATSYRRRRDHNFLVQLRGETSDGTQLEGLGDCHPRGARTRDKAPLSWQLVGDCLQQLEERRLTVDDPAQAALTVREVMAEWSTLAETYQQRAEELAREQRRTQFRSGRPKAVAKRLAKRTLRAVFDAATSWRRPRPFHGTLLGLEAALVDLVSRAIERPPATLLGERAHGVLQAMPQPPGSPDRREEIFETVLRRVLDYVAFPAPVAPSHDGRPATVYDEVQFLKPLGSNGTKGHLLEREALALGLRTTRFSKGAFTATDGEHPPLVFKWSRSPRSSAVSLALCTHKEATRMRLRRAGVPVPKGRTFTNGDFASARAFAERIGYPVVVKPAMGVRGIGVVANIADERELNIAFDQLVKSRLGKDDFIVEQHVTGRDYRIVVVGDEVIAAILREPASVEGDGVHSVAELVANKNAARRLNPHLWGRPIKYDDAARFQLERVGLDLCSVPPPGQRVLLSNSCSLSQGGDSIDVLEELHPSIKEACVRAVKAVPGLWFCGIDFLIEDHTRDLAEQRAGICELNAHAAIGNCEYPLYGAPRQVARTVIAQCVEHYGLNTHDKPADRLALKLTIRGRVTRVGYRTWLQRHARSFGLTGWVRNIDAQTVEAVLVGDAVPASALAAATVLGPRRARPTSVDTVHINSPAVTDFEILEHDPQERQDAR